MGERDSPSHLLLLSLSPDCPLGSMRREWDRERKGQEEKTGGGGGSQSTINIISMGAQNGLCQQNTDLLSRQEHEDERERWEERKGRERYNHGILQVCTLYGTHYISLIARNVVKTYARHWVWVKTSACKMALSSASIGFSLVTTAIDDAAQKTSEHVFRLGPLALADSEYLIHEGIILLISVKMTPRGQ